jgi:Domain of unknown function (DUF1992)
MMQAEAMSPSDRTSDTRREAGAEGATGRQYPGRDPDGSYETLPERLIREAIESGDFDDLPGAGKPLPGAGNPDDELWWVREWIQRNRDWSEGEWNSG